MRLLKPLPPLPASFLFGVSISDHQAEAYDDQFPPDVWDSWEKRQNIVPRGRATDFWNRWEEDIIKAHDLGCRAFRFSIAWARVEPQPGKFDQSVLDHYRSIVLRLRELNMEPIVTLCHFVWPQHVEDRGGLRSEQFAQWFAVYADRVRAVLDPQVHYWITFNEPNILLQGFYKLWFQRDFYFPPGDDQSIETADQIETTIDIIRHLFDAHAAARQTLRRDGGDQNLVSANVFQLGLPSFIQRLIDWNVKRLKRSEDWRDHLWRIVERPAVLSRHFDLVITPITARTHDRIHRLRTNGYDIIEFEAGLTALVRQDSGIDRLDQLNGKPIAIVRGPAWHIVAAIEARLNRSRIDYVETHDAAFVALESGQHAALIADRVILSGLNMLRPEYRLIDENITREEYAIGIETGHPGLLHAVEQTIRSLDSTANIIEVCNRYFPSALPEPITLPSEPLPLEQGPTKLRHIQDRGQLVIGVHRDDLPLMSEWLGTNRDRLGIEFDLGRTLARSIFGVPLAVEFHRTGLPRPKTILTRLRNQIDEGCAPGRSSRPSSRRRGGIWACKVNCRNICARARRSINLILFHLIITLV
jgi:Glycosyl hydrolase family 1/Bacterial extracellular solute-binding proteins, family 3